MFYVCAMTDERFTRLTDGQRDCLRYVLRGYQIKEIGRALGISPSTVNQRLERARNAIGASSSLAAARILAEHEGWPEIWIRAAGYENPLSAARPTTSSEVATNGSVTDDATRHTSKSEPQAGRTPSPRSSIKWPFPSAGRPDNDLTTFYRMAWVLPVAILSLALLMIVAMLSLGLQDMLGGLQDSLSLLF